MYADFFEEEKSKKKKNKRKLQEDGAIDKDVKKSKKYTFVKLLGAQVWLKVQIDGIWSKIAWL